MAKMQVSNPMDDGYPMGRQVDGTNVKECSAQEGSFIHFGKIRKGHRQYVNSVTGKRTEAPEYESKRYNDDVPHGGGY